MSEVPRINGTQAVKAFKLAGFVIARVKGSHFIMKKDGCSNRLSVPVHGNKTLRVGLLRSLISAAGMTVDEFAEYL